MGKPGLRVSYLTWAATASFLASALLAAVVATLLNAGMPDFRPPGREQEFFGSISGLFIAGVFGALIAGPVAVVLAIARRLVYGEGGAPKLTRARALGCTVIGLVYALLIGAVIISI